MFARFDENPAMTLRVIKETKRYGRTDGRTHGRTDGRTDNVKTVYPLQTKFAGGIIIYFTVGLKPFNGEPTSPLVQVWTKTHKSPFHLVSCIDIYIIVADLETPF